MGTIFSADYQHVEETVARCAYVRTGIRKFHHILSSPLTPLHRKIVLVKAYLFSGGFYNCGTWSELPYNMYKKVHACVLNVYRTITNSSFSVLNETGDLFSDADLIYKYQLVTPMTMLRSSRLLLFTRVMQKAPKLIVPLLFTLVEAQPKRGWVAALEKDLLWLKAGNVVEQSFSLKHTFDPVSSWHPTLLAKQIRKFSKTPFANFNIPTQMFPRLAAPVF